MIEERILELAERHEQQATADKRQAFARLQVEDPDTAAFLREVAKAFGKPAAVEIRFRDGTVFSTGDWGTT